ncbi:membrane protein [Gordonia phage SteveFrench]|uniref:Membrane protein n=2 Tax=Montyvirus stevefrench TaxID=2734258 RepID=A0A890V3E6_9CAUD|nr:membrane protein [Gordonia phage SteveFrench]AUV60638.1 membrane protein [Gordonia phage SteveFrench]QRI45621.1 membrane protein [Gordonia phage RoyalG]
MARGFGPFKKAPQAPDKIEALRGFLAIEAYALSLFAAYYGILTYRFGDSLWPPNRSALNVPWAPESWGTAVIIIAVLTMIASSRRLKWSKYVSWTMRTMCLVWGTFSITFFVDITNGAPPTAYPPMGTYLLLAVVCANRASLEDQWRE